jgi:hypothetical protein
MENKMDEACGMRRRGENNTGFFGGYLNVRAAWTTQAWMEG